MRLFALVLALAGCGRVGFDAAGDGGTGDPARVPSWTSGTRIHAQVADFGGGAEAFLTWYDTLLATTCSVRAADDGATHCVPDGAQTAYADSACTEPLAEWNGDPAAVPPFALEQTVSGSDCTLSVVSRAYHVLAERTVSTYYTRGATCIGSLVTAGLHLFDLSPALAPSELVAFAPVEIGGGRLHATGVHAEDGAQYVNDLVDSTLGERCAVVATTAGDRCVPYDDVASAIFSDAACTQPLGQSDCSSGGAFITVAASCGVSRVYERGPAYAGAAYQLTTDNQCVPTSTSGELDTLGPEVDPARFVGGTYAIDPAPAGRLARNAWTGSDGTQLGRGFSDTARGGERCSDGYTLPAGQRCYPQDVAQSFMLYSDAACTVPIAPYPASCPPPAYLYSFDTRGVALHAIDTAAPPPSSVYEYFSACTPQGAPPPGSYVSGVAATIPLDAFAPATIHLE